MAEWSEIDKAIPLLCEFLKGCPEPEKFDMWHVVFRMGTVFRIDTPHEGETVDDPAPDHGEFKGYESSSYEFPTHRVSGDGTVGDIMEENKKTWERQRVQTGTAGVVLRKAYGALVEDGYPYPGNQGSDRMAVPISGVKNGECLWMVLWPHRGPSITNLALCGNIGAAVSHGGDGRRYDYMFPCVHTIITPTGEVIGFDLPSVGKPGEDSNDDPVPSADFDGDEQSLQEITTLAEDLTVE